MSKVNVQLIVKMSESNPGEFEEHYGIKFKTSHNGLLIANDVDWDLVKDSVAVKRMKVLAEVPPAPVVEKASTPNKTAVVEEEEENEEGEEEEDDEEDLVDEHLFDYESEEELRDELTDLTRGDLKSFIAANHLTLRIAGKTNSAIAEEIIEEMLKAGKVKPS